MLVLGLNVCVTVNKAISVDIHHGSWLMMRNYSHVWTVQGLFPPSLPVYLWVFSLNTWVSLWLLVFSDGSALSPGVDGVRVTCSPHFRVLFLFCVALVNQVFLACCYPDSWVWWQGPVSLVPSHVVLCLSPHRLVPFPHKCCLCLGWLASAYSWLKN